MTRPLITAVTLLALLSGCASNPPLATVPSLDLDRYMGTWYVIGHIPPFLTDDAYNAIESYERGEDDRINVLFTYNKGAFDGPLKTHQPTGFTDMGEQLSEWGMRFIWPLKMDFRVAYVDPSYEYTIVGRNARDYAWILARQPIIDDARYQEMVERLRNMGYSLEKLRKVPQQSHSERENPDHYRRG